MNGVDLAILVTLTLGALYGLMRGAVRPIMGIVAIVVAFLLGRPLGDLYAPWLAETFSLSAFMGQRIAAYTAGFFVYVCARFVGSWMETYFIERVTAFKVFNRLGGTVLGGLFVALVLCSGLLFFAFLPQSPIRRHLPSLWASQSYQWVKSYNPFMHPSALAHLRELRSAVSQPKKFHKLKESPEFQRLLNDYEMPTFFEEPTTLDRLRRGDYKGLVQNERIERLARDEQLENLMEQLGTPGLDP